MTQQNTKLSYQVKGWDRNQWRFYIRARELSPQIRKIEGFSTQIPKVVRVMS